MNPFCGLTSSLCDEISALITFPINLEMTEVILMGLKLLISLLLLRFALEGYDGNLPNLRIDSRSKR